MLVWNIITYPHLRCGENIITYFESSDKFSMIDERIMCDKVAENVQTANCLLEYIDHAESGKKTRLVGQYY